MSIERNKNNQTSDLLDDINFINESNIAEIGVLGHRLRQRIGEETLTEEVNDLLINEVSTQLGQLTTKVKLTEKAIHSLQSRQKLKARAGTDIAVERKEDQSGVSFPANIISENNNMLPVEKSPDGISFCWTGAAPETRFSFSVDRSKILEMQIRVIALIKPEYSKQLKVFIDDAHVKHRFSRDGSMFVVSCLVPVSSNASMTRVKICLPATHSPSELGDSQDGRKLGIAISEIHFGKPGTRLTHFLKKLKIIK